MFDFRLHVCCLVLILYLLVMYAKETAKLKCDKFFDAILFVAPWAIVFDAASFYTVNHMDSVPSWLNYGTHLMFFVLMILLLTFSALYMYNMISGFKEYPLFKIVMMCPGILAIALTVLGIGNVQFIQGVHTNYSLGFSVYVCFATVFVYYGFILFLILLKRKYLPEQKRVGAISFIVIVGIILILQMIFNEFLVTSIAATVIVVGIYIEFENPAIRKLELQNKKIVNDFSTMVENRDDNTGGHIKRTQLYVELLLKKMQHDHRYIGFLTKDYIANVSEAAPLHDIGKISTPDQILRKPGKLTDEEYAVMKEHAAKGGEIIQSIFTGIKSEEAKKIAFEVARHHHEKYNGKGYPDGLCGEQIPLHARVMAIADVFDAVSQKRCYRDAMPLEQCFEIIEKGADTDFDPHLVKLFLQMKDALEDMCVISQG